MEVRNIRWVGSHTSNYDAMKTFLSDVMGLRITFDEPTTTEFSTTEGDQIQIMAPGDPYYDFFATNATGPVPLFEVDDLHQAREELVKAGIDIIGPTGTDAHWQWIHFRAPDGNLYELASRR